MFKRLKKFIVLPLIIAIVLSILPMPLFTVDIFAGDGDPYYWAPVAGSGTGNWSDVAHWSSTDDGTGGDYGTAPNATNPTFFATQAFTGAGQTVTVDAAAYCLDMDWTGATNTPTLTLVAPIYAYGDITVIAAMVTTGAAYPIYTRGTTVLTSNTHSFGCRVGTFADSTSLTLADAFVGTSYFIHQGGIFATGNFDATCTTFQDGASATAKTFTLGSSTINCTSWVSSGSNNTLTANTATINVTGTGAVALGTADYDGADFNLNGTAHTVSGSPTGIAVFTRNGTATKTDSITLTSGTTLTCTTFAMIGNSATNRLLVQSSTLGTAATITATNWTGFQNVDCMDITATNAVDLSGGSSGDCGGNTGITFTTAAAQISNATGNWSTLATWQDGVGTDRVPLPQDDVSCSHNVTVDMPRIGKSITFTGTPTASLSNSINTYGSFTLVSGMTYTHNDNSITFRGRDSYTLTSAGKTFYAMIFFQVGGTLTLQDDLISSFRLNHVIGTLTFNNYNVTAGAFYPGLDYARTLNLGSGTLTLNSTTLATKWSATANLTLNAGTSTIIVTYSGVVAQTFVGGGKTYNHVRVEGAGAYTLTMTGTNVIDELIVNAPAGTTLLNAVQDIATLTHTSGTVDLNDLNHTIGVFDSNNANVRIVNMGTGTLTVDSVAAVTKWNITNPTNLTFNHENCTIVLTNAAATAQTFAGGGRTYNNVTVGGAGNYALTLSGNNTFATFTIDRSVAAKTLTFTSGSTQTMTTPVCATNLGVIVTINSTIPGTPGNLVMAGGGTFDGDFLNITDSAAYPNPAWYAVRSIDGGGVTGWIFHALGMINHAWYQPNYMVTATDYDGTASGGTTTTIIDAGLIQTDDYWNNALVTITSAGAAAPEGETSVVTDFDDASNTLTVAPAFTVAVQNTDKYTVDFGTLIDRSYYGIEFVPNDDVIACGAAADMDITDTATLTAWIYVDTDGQNNEGSIIDRRDATPDGYRLYVSSEAAGNVAIEVILDAATDAYAVSNVEVSTGTWHYIVAVYNRLGTFHWEIYEDGVLLGLGTDQAGVLPITGHTANVMNIGNNAANNRCFDGLMDEPSFYTTAWTQALVTANYNAGLGLYTPTNTTGLALQLHMEEGSGTDVADTSGELNNGTITNAVWINGYVPRPAGNSGTNDSRVTWGANPAGVAVTLGGMVSQGQPAPGSLPSDPAQEILPETPVSDWYIDPDLAGLLDNPLRPFVVMMSGDDGPTDTNTLTEIQAWRILALAVILLITVGTGVAVGHHQGITMIAAGMAILGAVVMTIYPMWALVFAIGMFIGGLVMERSPSL